MHSRLATRRQAARFGQLWKMNAQLRGIPTSRCTVWTALENEYSRVTSRHHAAQFGQLLKMNAQPRGIPSSRCMTVWTAFVENECTAAWHPDVPLLGNHEVDGWLQ